MKSGSNLQLFAHHCHIFGFAWGFAANSEFTMPCHASAGFMCYMHCNVEITFHILSYSKELTWTINFLYL